MFWLECLPDALFELVREQSTVGCFPELFFFLRGRCKCNLLQDSFYLLGPALHILMFFFSDLIILKFLLCVKESIFKCLCNYD